MHGIDGYEGRDVDVGVNVNVDVAVMENKTGGRKKR